MAETIKRGYGIGAGLSQNSRWLVTFSLGGERWTVGVSAKTREQARQLAWEDARDFAGEDYPRVVCCGVDWEGREEL